MSNGDADNITSFYFPSFRMIEIRIGIGCSGGNINYFFTASDGDSVFIVYLNIIITGWNACTIILVRNKLKATELVL
ncbi:hypothetical protein D3C76_1319130 [compost metagenome]